MLMELLYLYVFCLARLTCALDTRARKVTLETIYIQTRYADVQDEDNLAVTIVFALKPTGSRLRQYCRA
jgi:hypothetical protein